MIALADIKLALGIAPTDTSADAYLTAQEEMVAAAVELVTGRQWVEGPYTDAWRFPSSAALYVREWPIASVTTLTIDGTAQAAGDFAVDAYSGRVLRGQRGTQSFRGADLVEIAYVGGHNPLPAWLRHALTSVMSDRYALRGTGGTVAAETSNQTASRITVQDVGTVAYESTSSSASSDGGYDRSAVAGILGPHIRTFEQHRDYALGHGAGGE